MANKETSTEHATRAHARFSISALHRILKCPGSVVLIEALNLIQTPSSASLKGTRQHEVNQKAVGSFLEFKLSGTKDDSWREEVEDIPEIQFEADEAIETADLYVKLIWEKVLNYAITGKAYGIEDKLNPEEYKALDIWGSCDFWCIYIDDRGRRVAVVVDYKNGHYGVEIKKNPQLMGYGLLFLKEIREQGKDLDLIRTVIIQPNSNVETYREASYTPKQLMTFEKSLLKAVRSIVEGKSVKFKTGEWCGFCEGKATCKEFLKNSEQKMALKILDESEPVFPVVETLTDKQLALISLHGKDFIDFVKAVDLLIIDRARSGNPVADVKVVEGTPKRKWLEDTAFVAAALKARGVEPYGKPKLTTMAEAKKVMSDKELEALCSRGNPPLHIVPLDDKRPAIGSAKDLLTEKL